MSPKLTIEEVSHLLFLFEEMDKNGDGLITKAELKWEVTFFFPRVNLIMVSREGWLKALQGKLTEEEVEKLIAEADSDGDGKVNFEEFVRAIAA